MKIKKILFIAVILMFLLLVNTQSFAIDPLSYKPNSMEEEDYAAALPVAEKVIGGITTTGIVVSVVSVMALGIKYMCGSIEEKAEYKKSMMPMLIGMVMLFGISWIIKLIYDIVSDINV